MPSERDSPHRPSPQLSPPELYLSKMGEIWLWTVAGFTLGMIFWFGAGLGAAGLIAGWSR